MKKKIKSVRVLPAAFERSNVIEDAEDLRSSNDKIRESKVKNEKQDLRRLMKIYDLV